MASIERSIRHVQDLMRQDSGVDGDAQRLGQLAWLMATRVITEQAPAKHLPSDIRWGSWANGLQRLRGPRLVEFVNDRLFGSAIPELASSSSDYAQLLAQVLSDTGNLLSSVSVLERVVDWIGSLKFDSTTDAHLIGDLYERLLNDLQAAGNSGEFYTPRALTDFAARVVNPGPGETLMDPACGTGGFLVSALRHFEAMHPHHGRNRLRVKGNEKKALPHLLCSTNLILHGLTDPNAISRCNSLDVRYSSVSEANRVDVILTNPPFGGQEEPGIETNFPEGLRSRETADLFISLVVNLLRDGGRAGIVLPDGPLFGGGAKTRIRRMLLESCEIQALFRLPPGVFSPYTGISTNLLFFRKGRPTKRVWFFEHRYPQGLRSYSKTNPIATEHLSTEERWLKRRRASDQAWVVPIREIKESDWRLDLSNPSRAKHRNDGFASLVEELRSLDESVQTCRTRLSDQLRGITHRETRLGETLANNIDLLCRDAKDVDIVRQALLSWAMRGGLSDGAPLDSSADELLTKLASLKEGHRTSLPFSSSPQQGMEHKRVPFEIPGSWRWASLGQLGRIVGGGTPRASEPANFASDGIPWLTPADLNGNRFKHVSRGRRDLSKVGLRASSATLMPPGSVLFSSRAPIGYVAIAGCELATNQGFKSCVPFLPEMSEFIYYALKEAAPRVDANAPGTTFREVSGRAMASVLLPVPPMEEQKRIVEQLDTFMARCDELESACRERAERRSDLTDAGASWFL